MQLEWLLHRDLEGLAAVSAMLSPNARWGAPAVSAKNCALQ